MQARIAWLAAGVFVFASRSPASAQETTGLVSVNSSGRQGNGASGLNDPSYDGDIGTVISADAAVVAFGSEASNLVSGDTNGKRDVFLRDRAAGTTELVSVDSSGIQGNGDSGFASISGDGRYVAFMSSASNLVANDKNGHWDVFVRDRSTGVTERVSVGAAGFGGNADSGGPSISADGRYVVFSGAASNLVAGDTNGVSDVFLRDRTAGTTERISVDSSGGEANDDSWSDRGPLISSDGSLVVFSSRAWNLVANDRNYYSDIYLRDRSAGTTELLSVSSSGVQADWWCLSPSISSDGTSVAFCSYATTLIDGVRSPWIPSIYVHDRDDATTELLSVDSSGVEGNAASERPSIAADGQVVAFTSIATNLVPNDKNGFADVFVHERCVIDAAWSNYGQGWPGTNGIPSFVPRSNPVRGQSLTLDVGSSSGSFAFGLLLVGYQRADAPSSWGGELLVAPALKLSLGLAPNGASVTGTIPDDDRLCGVLVDLQVLESDPGASRGVSFTEGLELVLGK
jgi:Tol biopolymer transport system component